MKAFRNKTIFSAKTNILLSTALFFALILAPSFASAQEGIITTVAGTGTAGFSGDGGPATQAQLVDPQGLAFDSVGNLYIADFTNNRVRKVDTSGIIRTVTGDGYPGYSGDGGPATQARLNRPKGVYVSRAENLYIADSQNFRVRKIDTNGIITAVAGGGTLTGVSLSEVEMGTYDLGDGGLATQAILNVPADVALDNAGNIYITAAFDHRVRRVDTNGIITTVAGSGPSRPLGDFSGDGGPSTQARLNGPIGIAVDSAGNLYIADYANHRVRKVDTSGIITTVAGSGPAGWRAGGFSGDGGPATQARLNGPSGIAVDSAGNLYIADVRNHRVRKVDVSGIITTVAGTGVQGFSGDGGQATQAGLGGPEDVALDNIGNLYIADTLNNRVRKVTFGAAPTAGSISGVITNALTGAAISGATVSTSTGGYSATSASNGAYTMSNVALGTYTVTASASGYQSSSQQNISVTAGATTTVNLALTPTAGFQIIAGSLSPYAGEPMATNSVRISATVTHPDGLSQIEWVKAYYVVRPGQEVELFQLTDPDGDGTFSHEATTTPLLEGEYLVVIKARDRAGRMSNTWPYYHVMRP